VNDLCDTLAHHGAIGLAAPQIGVMQRVLVIHVPDDDRGRQVYINPEIIAKRGLAIIEESCLSLPGIEGRVMRAAQVVVRTSDCRGRMEEREIDGLHAMCLQHEIDHLNGKLFSERLSWFRRLRMRGAA
jgi:peptide deformylase